MSSILQQASFFYEVLTRYFVKEADPFYLDCLPDTLLLAVLKKDIQSEIFGFEPVKIKSADMEQRVRIVKHLTDLQSFIRLFRSCKFLEAQIKQLRYGICFDLKKWTRRTYILRIVHRRKLIIGIQITKCEAEDNVDVTVFIEPKLTNEQFMHFMSFLSFFRFEIMIYRPEKPVKEKEYADFIWMVKHYSIRCKSLHFSTCSLTTSALQAVKAKIWAIGSEGLKDAHLMKLSGVHLESSLQFSNPLEDLVKLIESSRHYSIHDFSYPETRTRQIMILLGEQMNKIRTGHSAPQHLTFRFATRGHKWQYTEDVFTFPFKHYTNFVFSWFQFKQYWITAEVQLFHVKMSTPGKHLIALFTEISKTIDTVFHYSVVSDWNEFVLNLKKLVKFNEDMANVDRQLIQFRKEVFND